MGMPRLSLGLGAVGVALVGIFLANTDFCLTGVEPATLEYLENADLRDGETLFKAKALWEKSGAVVMAVRRPGWALCREEASGLSSLKPQLEELGVPLYAVVKEHLGTEVQDFRQYFTGDIFVDEQKTFYGPQQRKMAGLGFLRLGVWQNFIRTWKAGYEGNFDGEGFILGGVYVIGAGKQGILLEHREKEFGNIISQEAVLDAVKKIQKEQ